MKVKDFMTLPPVYSCGQDTTLPEAAQIMKEKNCGMLPVYNRMNKVIGIITDRDICLALAGTYGRDLHNRRIGDISDGEVYSVLPDDDIGVALQQMRQHKVNRLPVLDQEGKIAGMLSVNDILSRVVGFRREEDGNAGDEYETLFRTLDTLIRRDNRAAGA